MMQCHSDPLQVIAEANEQLLIFANKIKANQNKGKDVSQYIPFINAMGNLCEVAEMLLTQRDGIYLKYLEVHKNFFELAELTEKLQIEYDKKIELINNL